MARTSSAEELARLILQAKRVLVLSHYNPDADAYGSSCGLVLALRSARAHGIGPEVKVLNESGILERYAFLPAVRDVQADWPQGYSADLIVACDCGDLKRIGDRLLTGLPSALPIVNIDHHISNASFGSHNLVCVEASSTSEIIYGVIKALSHATGKELLTAEAATCLFAGISGDTGSFRYASARESTFAVALELVRAGAHTSLVARNLYGRESLSAVKLQAEALLGLSFWMNDRVAVVSVSAEMRARHHASVEDTEALVERARDIEGVEVAVFMREEADFWKVSLRAQDAGDGRGINVAKIAEHFGGGGHRAAAGFRTRLPQPSLAAALQSQLLSAFADSGVGMQSVIESAHDSK
jgi:phosphoesterase RecJ-like protein